MVLLQRDWHHDRPANLATTALTTTHAVRFVRPAEYVLQALLTDCTQYVCRNEVSMVQAFRFFDEAQQGSLSETDLVSIFLAADDEVRHLL